MGVPLRRALLGGRSQPWWTFPGAAAVGDDASLLGTSQARTCPIWLLVAWMVVLGTIVPFVLVVGALQHITATRVGIVAMLEPVIAILLAWLWLGESLEPVQLVGRGPDARGIVLAQTAR